MRECFEDNAVEFLEHVEDFREWLDEPHEVDGWSKRQTIMEKQYSFPRSSAEECAPRVKRDDGTGRSTSTFGTASCRHGRREREGGRYRRGEA